MEHNEIAAKRRKQPSAARRNRTTEPNRLTLRKGREGRGNFNRKERRERKEGESRRSLRSLRSLRLIHRPVPRFLCGQPFTQARRGEPKSQSYGLNALKLWR